jgi:hypothetical protein
VPCVELGVVDIVTGEVDIVTGEVDIVTGEVVAGAVCPVGCEGVSPIWVTMVALASVVDGVADDVGAVEDVLLPQPANRATAPTAPTASKSPVRDLTRHRRASRTTACHANAWFVN